jgi:hypothetical protein
MTTPAPGDLINGWRVAELDKMQKRASVRCSSCGFTLFASVEALVDASLEALRLCEAAERPFQRSSVAFRPRAREDGIVRGGASPSRTLKRRPAPNPRSLR